MVYSSEHIVSSYEEELTQLASTLLEMGGMVEAAIASATEALLTLDHDRARQIIADDKKIDALQARIDEAAVSMIARRQPMASDLRMIIAAIHVANDLERVGDMAKQIGKRTLEIESTKLSPQFYNGIRHMTELVLRQIEGALEAFSKHSPEAAIAVCQRDDEVDALYMSLFRELLTYMMEDPRNITQCTHLLFVGKSLERTGDHATNIAEQAYYYETGRTMPQALEELTGVKA